MTWLGADCPTSKSDGSSAERKLPWLSNSDESGVAREPAFGGPFAQTVEEDADAGSTACRIPSIGGATSTTTGNQTEV